MNRIYIFTGKGGVGKSSVAAAHAIKSAEEGKKTLLVSTDMAHNLGDIFMRKLGKEAESVMPDLDIYEIDPEYVMEHDVLLSPNSKAYSHVIPAIATIYSLYPLRSSSSLSTGSTR